MKTKNIVLAFAGIALSITLFNACKKDTTTTGAPPANGSMAVRLTDAPGNFQQVNVDIQQVSVHMSGGSWIDLPTHTGIYNLLVLQNGIDTSLVNTTVLPAGKITQMRLILGTHNTVMVDSVVYPLTVPSGSQTGIKLIGNETVNPNQLLIVKLDFDANASVVASGTTYQLKPTVKVIP
ncbi:MAG TPA: DUF4382 domain-containing protein [Bacteroidia bacterium]|nr:DUF4382 domain-containing protein [Bacteroidia bacterium]